MKLVISPHNDDESLFCAFTIQREQAQVVIVFDSYIQHLKYGFKACNFMARRNESIQACKELGVDPPIFLGIKDTEPYSAITEEKIIIALKRRFDIKDIEAVWCPAEESKGHDQHNMVSRATRATFGGLVKDQYLTYQRGDGLGKSTSPKQVQVMPEWAYPKVKALACYKTQLEIPELGCWPHFLRSQMEYYL